MRKVNPRHKILVTLIVLSLSPVVIAASIGLIDLENRSLMSKREDACRALANQCSEILERFGPASFPMRVENIVEEQAELKSLKIERSDGIRICEIDLPTRDEPSWWKRYLPRQESEADTLTIPISKNGAAWLSIQADFVPLYWHETPLGRLLSVSGFIALLNLISFGLFLKRTLSFMDPKNAVPTRVRNTLDTISSGIVLLDCDARIMVINDAFSTACQVTREQCIGGNLDQFDWNQQDDQPLPWHQAFETKLACTKTVELKSQNSGLQVFNTNATPIFDASDALAGVLVSFENVTQIEAQRKDLLKAFRELEINKEQIRRQNDALRELASRDALTGAHNRRALFEFLDDCWCNKEQYTDGIIGIMMDVDHFKKLNDVHGHAVGDAVLKDVVKVAKAAIESEGFFGRYGGEEFCIILPGYKIENGLKLAEKVRIAIESNLAVPYAVTTSVGVSSSIFDAATSQGLIEQADKALYAAKHLGRNQTQLYSENVEELASSKNTKSANTKLELRREDLPISYQAAVSLHTALLYKHPPTAIHSQRVAELAISLARGLLSVRDLYVLEIAALLHDVGMISVPDNILQDHSKQLTRQMRLEHCENGVAIVQAAFHSVELTNVLRFHLCRFDGRDQPSNLPCGLEIPIAARIVGLVNAYDELVTGTSERPALKVEEAFLHLQLASGTRFDPELVDRFTTMQTGWRVDSSFVLTDYDNRRVVDLGHHLERAMYAFDNGDIGTLSRRLEMIASVADAIDMDHIARIANHLNRNLERKTMADLEGLLPIMQDLIETCGAVLRAYLRGVVSNRVREAA